MNVSTITPAQQPAATPVTTQQAVAEQPAAQPVLSTHAALSSGQGFQVNLGNIFRSALENLSLLLNQQESMLRHLSPDVANAVRTALKQPFLLQETLPQGFVSLMKAPKMLSEQMTQLAALLEDAAKLQQQAPRGVPQDIQKALAETEKQIRQVLTQIKTAVDQSKAAEQSVRTNAGLTHKNALPGQTQATLSQTASSSTVASPQTWVQGKMTAPSQEVFAGPQQSKQASSRPAAREITSGRMDNLPASGRLALLTTQVLDRPQQEQMVKTLFQQMFASANKGILENPAAAKQAQRTETQEQSLLRQMADQAEKSMPKIIQQAASRYDTPQLKQAWTALRMNEALAWAKQPRETLAKDAQIVKEIAASIQQTVSFAAETQGKGQTTLNFSLPLYFGDALEPYPAHIHIFNQQEDDSTAETTEFETWMKISLMTEHMGQVDTVFRLYKKELLDIRVLFSNEEAAEMFNGFVPAIRAGFNDAGFSLKLADIMIGT
ncbi:hypothetical protein [Acetonema longum]|uniref:Uncharacterized protein n=1 Tax=Acetonema longum DSM 6540 TaxID=1009370 RepID=F7NL21_9FIRM|nr:hypothetical protein [Acetonema longum]EGO63126.1 hypothetical protein ALO_13967 [Acetonema longum DSM 6540]